MSECTGCKHGAKHGHEEPCVRCGTGKFSLFEPEEPQISQDTARDLLAACKTVIACYSGTKGLKVRDVKKQLREAIAKAEGGEA